MARVITGDIQDLTVSWENYSGESVENFIKEQLAASCGYIYRSSVKEGNYYYLYGFHSVDDYNNWISGDVVTPLFRVQLPNIENDVYSAVISTNSNTNKIVNLGDGVSVNIKYTSIATNPTTGDISDTYNEGTLIITRSANGSSYIEVARINLQPVEHGSTTYQSINITNYLADGDNIIRMRVEDNVNGAVSNTIVFNSIVNTTLRVTNATSITTPLYTPSFQYYIEGEITKTLNINITQNGNTSSYSFSIGTTTYTETTYLANIEDTFNTGAIQVETWLSVDDTTLESEHITNQFYYIAESSTEDVIILNNVETSVVNYTNTHFFDFVVYNAETDVQILIQSNGTTYIDYTFNNCEVNTNYSFYNILQIESSVNTISATVTIITNSDNQTYTISIDNTEKMSPTAGANFILNPLLRNNTEENPARIINSSNSNVVTSTFNNFGFVNDGWLSDTDGIKVLRIPAGRSINIEYDPLDTLTNGTTIEIDYKVYNVFNDEDEVIKMYTLNGDNVLGFVMNATEAAFYTSENQTKRDQDVMFQEEVRTHLAINIIPNLANSGLNYIRMFINGVMNREMLYTGTDVFKNGAVDMIFGSNNCDLDIYSIRIYKSALSATDVRQDYMSSIPTLDGKLAFKAANNILSANGTISYDKASVLYNTLVWTGNHPEYSTGNQEYAGKLQINIIDDPSHSGTITNLRIKGQGSSSRGYWKWNHQYDMNKLEDENENTIQSVWTDGNGNEHTDGYRLTDDDPAAKKLVAKLNWASSMQSHKIGSTALYTDLWREIVGGNSITNTEGYEDVRVSVHEKPFLYFIKSSETATPVFSGLMTFGSGKYDKATFGYDKNVFPNYLIIEGSDNGMPLTNRQVPWFEDEVTYNSDEEYYEYAGQGNWDYGMGNQNMLHYFIDASNFVYLHSIRLAPYAEASELVDPSYQYWNTSTYNVVRYDWINEEWVNAGTTKTDGEYDVLNIVTQTSVTPTGNSTTDNAAFIAWRINDFKTNVGLYYNVNDVIFSMAFLKMVAASDNRCKNTYEYLDPTTYKICLAQDDMDTLMLTDNVGRKTKPYYVEEHDTKSDGSYYFNGEDNNFFTLMDNAFNSELRAMMKSILTTMTSSDFGGSVEDCLQNYFFDVQEYFPAVAFNETARLLYEAASVAQSNGVYTNGTPAISQSLGDQLQGEKQWWNRRIKYLQSWSSTDPFYVRSTTDASLQFRSLTTTSSTNPTYQFTLTPWQWLYPKVGTGQTPGQDNTRVQAGNEFTTMTLSVDGNTDTFIYGANYYTNFGEFGDKSIGEAFPLVGSRLLEFSADSREVSTYEFRPTSMTVNCPVLKKLTLYGCSTLAGSLDLSGCIKLEELDLRGTSLSSVVLPQTDTLTTVYLPTLTSLTIVNCNNISTLSLESYSNLISLTTDNSTLAVEIMENAANLANVTLYNIDITTDENNVDDIYNILVNATCTITGSIYLDKELNSTEKTALEEKYGSNVFASTSAFNISFITSPITSVTLTNSKDTIGSNDTLTINVSYEGNDDAAYAWTVESDNDLTLTRNKTSLVIESGSLTSAESLTVTYTLTKMDNTTVSASTTITLMPYTFLINGENISNYSIEMLYGSADSSVTYTDGWEITCNNESANFTLDSVSITGGSAVISGNNITSITKTNLSNGGIYTANITITVDEMEVSYSFNINTNLVSMSINDISDIQARNGSGSGNVTFSYNSTYASNITVVSATVSSGNTNTVSNLTIDGCTITVSGYSSSASKVLTLNYKINNGSNCTVTKSFTVAYVEQGATLRIGYTNLTYNSSLDKYACYVFSSNGGFAGWPTSNGSYIEQNSCSVEYGGTTYNLTWDSTNEQYHYSENDVDLITVRTVLYISPELYNAEYTPYVNLELSGSYNFNDFYYAFYANTCIISAEIYDCSTISNYAFYNCSRLTSLVIGSEITMVKSYSFYNCTQLNSITSYAITAPSISSNTFYNVKQGGTLTYPEGSDYSTWLSEDSYYLGYYKWNTIEVTDGTLVYTLTAGGNAIVKANSSSKPVGSLVIPSTYTYNGITYNITEIEKGTYSNGGFAACTGMTSIVIPDSVTKIGEYAFYNCTGLTSVTLSNSITSIQKSCFNGCSSLTTINIPSTITRINESAFSNCSSLTGMSLPNSCTNISDYAFIDCSGLTNFEIGTGTTYIGGLAFARCTGLTTFDLKNVETIGTSAFLNCTGLTSLYIPSTVRNISGGSGYYKWYIQPWEGCSGLTSITVDSNNTNWNDGNGSNCIIHTSDNWLITGCKNSTMLNNITAIGPGAFSGCSGLNTITIPNTVTIIEQRAFENCTGLTSIAIPDSVTKIGSVAFGSCSNLLSISIGSGITTIDGQAFDKCTKVNNISINKSTAPTISSGTWGYESASTGYSSGTTNVLYVPQDATGYDGSNWTNYLLNASYGKFTLSATL